MHHGSCLCKNVKYEVVGDFDGFFFCHCSRCRKVTGSVHGANLFSRSGRLIWITGEEHIRTFKLEGTRFQKSFCVNCSGALPSLQAAAGLLVPAGSLDSELTTKPTAHICWDSRASWEKDLDKVQKFDGLPGR